MPIITMLGGGGDSGPDAESCGANLLATGAAWLAGRLKAYASSPIVYRRGDSAVALCATFGKTLLRLDDGLGAVRIEWTDKDYIISADDLVLDDQVVRPAQNDIIEYDDGTSIHTYQVLPYGPDEPQWRWCDPHMKMIRIHCKRISTEPA
jgi:hypothetical protein